MKNIQQQLTRIELELELEPDSPALWNDRGVGCHLLGHYEEAIKSFHTALDHDRNNSTYHFNLANSYLENDQIEPAISHYQSAIDRTPDHIPALNNLADAWELAGDPARAGELFEHLVRISPDEPLSHFNLGNFYLRQNRHIEASRCYETTIRLDPGFTDAYFTIAWILEQVGAASDAAAYAERGLSTDPDHEELRRLHRRVTGGADL